MTLPAGFKITWEAYQHQHAPPEKMASSDGADVDLTQHRRPACKVRVPYPAPLDRGLYRIKCITCGTYVVVPTASRPDDPRSVMLACRRRCAVEEILRKQKMAKRRTETISPFDEFIRASAAFVYASGCAMARATGRQPAEVTAAFLPAFIAASQPPRTRRRKSATAAPAASEPKGE